MIKRRCQTCFDIGMLDLGTDMSDCRQWKRRPLVICPACTPRIPETFEGFRTDGSPDLVAALEATKAWVDGTGPAMLSLSGNPGRGKSHLMQAALQALRDRYIPAGCMGDRALDNMIRLSFADGDTSERMEQLISMPWLLLDDYGTIQRNPQMAGLIDDLFVHRWANAREGHDQVRTMLTTNLGGDELPMRMASRFMDRTRARSVYINAPDYRQEVRDE